MHDYQNEADAVCKYLGGMGWNIEIFLSYPAQYSVSIYFYGCPTAYYNMDSEVWKSLVRKATRMTDEELDQMLEEMYQNEVFLDDMTERLSDLEEQKRRTIEVIDEVKDRIRRTRDKLKGN